MLFSQFGKLTDSVFNMNRVFDLKQIESYSIDSHNQHGFPQFETKQKNLQSTDGIDYIFLEWAEGLEIDFLNTKSTDGHFE